MGSDLGYKHYGNVCGNPNRLGPRSVTYSARASGLGTGPVCPAPTRSSLVAERYLDVQSGPCNAATTARCCTLYAVRCTLYAVRCALYADHRTIVKRFRTLVKRLERRFSYTLTAVVAAEQGCRRKRTLKRGTWLTCSPETCRPNRRSWRLWRKGVQPCAR